MNEVPEIQTLIAITTHADILAGWRKLAATADLEAARKLFSVINAAILDAEIDRQPRCRVADRQAWRRCLEALKSRYGRVVIRLPARSS